jgi:SAM-dependent methyltransferase
MRPILQTRCDIVGDDEVMSQAFDRIGAQYSEIFADKPGQVAATQWLMAQLKPDAVVLDVGSGSGLPTAGMLSAAGFTVVGVDTSPVMLELARRNVPTGMFVERELPDLAGLLPREGRFDGAAAFFSLLMLTREDVGRALDAVRAVLSADGVFVLGMVEGDTDFMIREFLGVPVPLTAYPRADLHALLHRHGFTVLEMRADAWAGDAPDAPEQIHLYAYCHVTPTM